eukprot:993547_1
MIINSITLEMNRLHQKVASISYCCPTHSLKKLLVACSLATSPTMASTLGTELLLLLVSVSIGHCSNVCLSHLIYGPTLNAMDTNSTHYNLTLITTLGFIATVVMAVLNITPTMDLQNIDTINTPNASQM